MKGSIAAVAAFAASASAACTSDYQGTFNIQTTALSSKRDALQKRACSGTPIISLKGGVLSDPTGRIGNVVSNHQFQFDPAPGQDGAIFTSGFQVCDGTTLSVGGSTTFYACASGSFSNLYDNSLPNPPAQCSKVQIMVVGCDGQVSTPVKAQASQKSDGQVVSTSVAQISDGQLQAATAATAVPTTIPLVTGKGTAPPVSAPTGLPTVVAPYPIANFTGFPAGSTPSASAPGSPAPTSGSGSGSGSGTTPFTGAAASMDVRWAHFGLAAFMVLIGATVL